MSIPEIIAYGEELAGKLNIIDNFDAEIEQRRKDMDEAYARLEKQADRVSDLRKKNGEQLTRALMRELKDLAFANSEFAIHTTRLPEIGPNGYDAMEYMISTNPGEPLRPLSRIASGGEISRIMLAFKHIIGDNDSVETMIFDEIDTGISGKTALVVAKKCGRFRSITRFSASPTCLRLRLTEIPTSRFKRAFRRIPLTRISSGWMRTAKSTCWRA